MKSNTDGKLKTFIKGLVPYVVIILVVVLIRSYIITPGVVNGASMEKTLYDGDLVLVNKIGLKFGIKRFDIVVVKHGDGSIIKRVIGLPGETVEYKHNSLYIDGKEIIPPIDFEETDDFKLQANNNEYIVLGDNRNISKDSRLLGPIKKEEIKGKVNFRIYPFKSFGTIL